MAAGIFVLDSDQNLVPMTPGNFVKESEFQDLLARHLSLLTGIENGGSDSTRWLLVTREMPIPDGENSSGRWSVDHLFLDQDGVPTLVEVKLQSNTELRRQVVGQILEYAANSTLWWSQDRIKFSFEASCEKRGVDSNQELSGFLGPEADLNAFWNSVQTNLSLGRVRLVFVAENIPIELQRIVEFLNKHMKTVEVVALELRQFMGQGMRTIVPVTYGRTSTEGAGSREAKWDRQSFYEALEQAKGAIVKGVVQSLEHWLTERTDEVWFGNGKKAGSMTFVITGGTRRFYPLTVWTSGDAVTTVAFFKSPVFADPALMEQWKEELQRGFGAGAKWTPTTISAPTSNLADPEALARFEDALQWTIDRMRSAGNAAPLPTTCS